MCVEWHQPKHTVQELCTVDKYIEQNCIYIYRVLAIKKKNIGK